MNFFYNLILWGHLLLLGCSGYHFSKNTNPLRIYDIESVVIPFFLNHSSITGVAGPMTREISGLLSSYSGLKVYVGASANKADAVLVGIISSDPLKRKSIQITDQRFTDGELLESLGPRRGFYLPLTKQFSLRLRLVLIKNPTTSELELISTDAGHFLKGYSKVIFDEELILQHQVTNVLFPDRTSDDGGVVALTQNKGIERVGMEELAKQARISFKQEILDAF